jgi:hypothetical protein
VPVWPSAGPLHLHLLDRGTKNPPPSTKCLLCDALLARKNMIKREIGAYVLIRLSADAPDSYLDFICRDCAADDEYKTSEVTHN